MSKVLVNGDSTGLDSVSGGTGEHVGLKGLATTDLRPAGKGDFNGRRLDVTAVSGFIAEGKVDVKKILGGTVGLNEAGNIFLGNRPAGLGFQPKILVNPNA
mgnify:CR=1 FL=1